MTDDEIWAAFDADRPVQYVIVHGGVPEWHARNLYKKWREAHPDAPKRSWKRDIKKLADKGLTEREIFAETGYSYKTIKQAIGTKKRALPPEVNRPVDNTGSKMCSSCIYRFGKMQFSKATGAKCNFIGITGHSRGSPAERCTRYQRGKRIEEAAPFEIK